MVDDATIQPIVTGEVNAARANHPGDPGGEA